MQQNSRCRLCGDRDETNNRIISECRKLALKEYKTGWTRWFTGNFARNWNLTIQTNGICTTQNLSWRMRRTNSSGVLRKKTDHLILARQPDLVMKKKDLAELWTLLFQLTTKWIWKKDKYLDFARELKKTMEHESDGDTNCNWCSRYSHQWFGTGTGGLGNKWTSGDHPKYSIIKINQNTEKSPGDLRLAVTQTLVRNPQLMLVCLC